MKLRPIHPQKTQPFEEALLNPETVLEDLEKTLQKPQQSYRVPVHSFKKPLRNASFKNPHKAARLLTSPRSAGRISSRGTTIRVFRYDRVVNFEVHGFRVRIQGMQGFGV